MLLSFNWYFILGHFLFLPVPYILFSENAFTNLYSYLYVVLGQLFYKPLTFKSNFRSKTSYLNAKLHYLLENVYFYTVTHTVNEIKTILQDFLDTPRTIALYQYTRKGSCRQRNTKHTLICYAHEKHTYNQTHCINHTSAS